MKRSEINRILGESKTFFASMGFHLPPVAFWTPEDWRRAGPGAAEIVDVGIGWDVTDLGFGDFRKKGLVLFTLRNGRSGDPRYPKRYAEKAMIVDEGQLVLTHYHWKKTEDIINRGGGLLVLELHNATPDNKLHDTPVRFSKDGIEHELRAGSHVTLEPGESITLTPGLYHSFWGAPGKGKVFVGEVSSVNNDGSDNCFYEPQHRYPSIEEDEVPVHLLVGDYPALAQFSGTSSGASPG
jgi:D-lyxose ketol-isomerase